MNRCLPHASAPSTTPASSRAAASAKRPCGLPTRTSRPAKARSSSPASRWRVWPSGIVRGATREGGVRQRRQLVVALVRRELGDPAHVALLAAERRGEEDLD